MASLGFDLLDRHVIDGHGDDIACTDADGSLTYALLLEQAAALGGGLRAIGLRADDEVALTVSRGNLQVVIVCACARIGAVPTGDGAIRIDDEGGTAVVHLDDETIDLAPITKAGKTDPASARAEDPPGYRDGFGGAFEHIVESLLARTPIT